MDIVNKSGAWYSYGEMRLGQGRENAKEFLRQNPELAKEIESKVKEKFGLNKAEEKNEQAPKKKKS